jgi:hypothetical protein
MTTLAATVTRLLISLNDEGNATWDTEMIATFLNDAIRDYTQHFPIQATDTIAMTTGTDTYDLNTDFMSVISVEYPDGEDPREYMLRRPYTHPDFWSVEGYYDIVHNDDDTNPSEIIFSTAVLTTKNAIVQYNAHHVLIADTASISGNLTVPPYHQHLLTHFVRWQASLHLASAEQQTPTSNSSLLMAQLAQNARRDSLAYSTALQQAIFAADAKLSEQHPWAVKGTGVERIY